MEHGTAIKSNLLQNELFNQRKGAESKPNRNEYDLDSSDLSTDSFIDVKPLNRLI